MTSGKTSFALVSFHWLKQNLQYLSSKRPSKHIVCQHLKIYHQELLKIALWLLMLSPRSWLFSTLFRSSYLHQTYHSGFNNKTKDTLSNERVKIKILYSKNKNKHFHRFLSMISANSSKRFPFRRDAPLWCQRTTSGMMVMAVMQTNLALSQTTTRAASPPSTEQAHVTMNMSNATMNPVSEVDITMTTVTSRKRSVSCTDTRIATPRNARVKGHGNAPRVPTNSCARRDAAKTITVLGITPEVHVGSDSTWSSVTEMSFCRHTFSHLVDAVTWLSVELHAYVSSLCVDVCGFCALPAQKSIGLEFSCICAERM